MKLRRFWSWCLLFLFLPSGALLGKTPQKDIDEAVAKGVKYLKSRQELDGTWAGKHGKSYPMGTTALAALTLLKCDVSPRDPILVTAFAKLEKMAPTRTYSVAIYIMALEARYTPPKKVLEKYEKKYSRSTIMRISFQRQASPKDKRKLNQLVNWILRTQEKGGGWRYPGGGEDTSNSQYCMLALAAAERMGSQIPEKVYWKALEYFLKGQEKDGPQVDPFPVPGAEEPIAKILRKRLEKKLNKVQSYTRTAERKKLAYGKSGEHLIYKSRGWSYVAGGKGWEDKSTGSMTTAGLAGMIICKARLEQSRDRRVRTAIFEINRSIRDGCAWLAKNFSVSANPKSGSWHYYYLYGLERAGVLSAVDEFGKHDWYEEGVSLLLKQQKDDGSFGNGQLGYIVDTCFALLFLKRATVPVHHKKPKRIVTGSGGR